MYLHWPEAPQFPPQRISRQHASFNRHRADWFFKRFISHQIKCFPSTGEPERGLTIKVRETLMRRDYDDGTTLAAVPRSVAKETVSLHAQRVPVLHAGG